MSREEIIHAYRHLYRGLLHAVQFEVRARVVARDQLRTAFREKGATYDATGIQRTIWFLKAAAKERGLEHKILKNLIRTAYSRSKFTEWGSHVRHITLGKQREREATRELTAGAHRHYDMTVAMLNKSMGLCLR